MFGDDIDEEELLEEIESEEKNDDDDDEVGLSGKESSSDDDSEGPDQVDSDDQAELMGLEQGTTFSYLISSSNKQVRSALIRFQDSGIFKVLKENLKPVYCSGIAIWIAFWVKIRRFSIFEGVSVRLK